MARLYGTRGSLHVPRPKHDQTLDPRCKNWICMRKWVLTSWAILFLRLQKGLRRFDIFRSSVRYQCRPWNKLSKKAHQGTKNKIIYCLKNVHFFCKNDYRLIADQWDALGKSIFQQIRRGKTIQRPPLESSQQEKNRSALYIFVWSFLTSYFLKPMKT